MIAILATLLLILLWPNPVQTTELGELLANWMASLFSSRHDSKASVLTQLEIWLNIAIFVPFSLSLFLILKRGRWLIAILASLILSSSAELIQKFVLTERVASVQDILLNLAGAWVGVGLGALINRLGKMN